MGEGGSRIVGGGGSGRGGSRSVRGCSMFRRGRCVGRGSGFGVGGEGGVGGYVRLGWGGGGVGGVWGDYGDQFRMRGGGWERPVGRIADSCSDVLIFWFERS